jgi:hypothetical protein
VLSLDPPTDKRVLIVVFNMGWNVVGVFRSIKPLVPYDPIFSNANS